MVQFKKVKEGNSFKFIVVGEEPEVKEELLIEEEPEVKEEESPKPKKKTSKKKVK